MSTEYCLRAIRLEGLQWKSNLHRKIPDLYVEVRFGDIVKRTRTIEKSMTPVWNEALIFSPKDSTIFEIRVKHDSAWLSDPCVGFLDILPNDLLEKCVDGEVGLSLRSSSRRESSSGGVIVLRLQMVDSMTGAGMSIKGAVDDTQRSAAAITSGLEPLTGKVAISGNQGDLYQAIGSLLSKLEIFRKVIDIASEVHPFLTIAWALTSVLYSAVENVFKTDRKIIDLVRSMDSAFAFVLDVQSLPDKIASLQRPLDGLLKQTIECCLFVRQYTAHSFLGRMLDTNASQTVDNFGQSLASFKEEIDSGLILHTALVSSRLSRGIDEIISQQRLSELRARLDPAYLDAFNRPLCLPKTRLEVRERITNWLFSETKQSILWLHGVAGSGKSTVSTTIASHLRDMSRLGAFLFFERGKSEPSMVIRTIAYNLALYDSSIGLCISREIENGGNIASAPAALQFNKLLLRPLLAAVKSISGPVFIVLDAFDECGTAGTRSELLEIIRRDFPKLPNEFRFVITSRKEPDIVKALSSQPESVHIVELDYMSEASQRDVLSYLHTEMHTIVREQVVVPPQWPWNENMELLGRAAGGLFVWASTAVKIVKFSDNPFRSLKELVSDSRLTSYGLEELYSTALRNSGIVWTKEESRERFTQVLALVLLAKIPLSSATIDGILGFPPEESATLVLSRLQCLLSFSPGGPVSLFHASFLDYLMSPKRSKDPWYIDIPAAKYLIVERCLSVMNGLLKFNICGLQSSFVRNDDVSNFEDRVEACVPPHLRYACIYWTNHLLDVPYSSSLAGTLSSFAYGHLLFWFEVLSLTKVFARVAGRALVDSAGWIEEYNSNIASFLRDASHVAVTFAVPVTLSTPHIYVSMLPLLRDDAQLSAHYSRNVSSMVQVQRRGVKRRPKYLKTLDGHSDVVCCVAISPDGRYIASASKDRTIRLWNVETGEETVLPLTGHSDNVRCVRFSRDGKRIVSGSRDDTLRIWDTNTGSLVLGPLEGHTDTVNSVDFSLDGTRIASGSADNTIIVWDATNGKPISAPFSGHTDTVNSVSFSPDGTRITSASDDGVIIIWDIQCAKPVIRLFEGHTGTVDSVAFSPDGTNLASGSDDGTVKIWEVESGKIVSTLEGTQGDVMSVAYSPCGSRIVVGCVNSAITVWDLGCGQNTSILLDGHSHAVSSVAWSSDGKYIVSGSGDRTVRIWDATVTAIEVEKFLGHTGPIMRVAFSPDGDLIASASIDTTVIVWNAERGDVVLGPLQGHTDAVNCIAFSSDGSRVISGSGDKTIRIWSARTGGFLSGPLHGHTECVNCIALSPDGSMLASGSDDETVMVWDLVTGELVAGPLRGHSDAVNSVIFSNDGKWLASGSDDKTVVIWNTKTWEAAFETLSGHTDGVNSISFSPDSTRIVSGSDDETIMVRDVEDGSITLGPLVGHDGNVTSVIFSVNGSHIISASFDGTIRIWNAETGRAVSKLECYPCLFMTLSLSPDGSRIASASLDETIRVWDVSDFLRPAKDVGKEITTASSRDWVLGDSGWMLGGPDEQELLLWIPPDLRITLWRPRNTAVFNCEFSTTLDFTGAALGQDWSRCFNTLPEEL